MKILGIIPARGGSKGIPGKNLTLMAGKPLLWYTIYTSLNVKYLNRVVVSTDDEKIAAYATSLGVQVIDRPAELADEKSLVIDAIRHTLDYLKETENYIPDYVVNLNPTSPLRTTKSLDKALHKLLKSNYDSVFSAFLSHSTYGTWEINADQSLTSQYDYTNLKRRQDIAQNLFVSENGAIYAVKTDPLKELNTIIGKNPTYCLMMLEESVDINTFDDIKRAEIYYEEFFKDYFLEKPGLSE